MTPFSPGKSPAQPGASGVQAGSPYAIAQTVCDVLPVAMWSKDADGRFVWGNHALLAMAGLESLEALIGLTDADVLPAEVAAGCAEHDRQLLTTGQPVVTEEGFMGADEQVQWLEVIKVPLLAADGSTLIGQAGMARDITPLRRTRQTLKAREAVLAALAEFVLKPGDDDTDASITQVLERLGVAVGADRAYVFENRADAAGVLRISQTYEWVREGVGAQIDNPELNGAVFAELCPHSSTVLTRGGVVAGPVAELPASDRPALMAQDIQSLIMVPVFTDGVFWGLLGFDDCHRPRRWQAAEVDTLRLAARALGSAIIEARALAALEESQQRLDLVLNGAGLGLWDWNLKTNDAVFNDLYPAMLGYDPAAFDQSYGAWEELLHPDDMTRVIQALHDNIEGRSPLYREEYRLRAVDGRWKWILDMGRVVAWDDDGQPLRMVGTHTDITERREAEVALEANRDLLRKIAANIPGVIYQCRLMPDKKLALPYASDRLWDFYGIRPGDAVDDTAPLMVRVNEQDRGRLLESIRQSLRQFEIWTCEYRARGADGRERWLEGRAVPEKEPDGSVVWHGFVFDVSDRKQMEEQLELASRALGRSHDGIMITDAAARIVTVNRAFTDITGYSASEAVGHNPRFLASGRHGPTFYEAMWRDLRGSGHWQGELWNRRRDGEVYPERLSISSVIDDDGEISHYIAIFNDISERKASEARIEFLAHHDPLTHLPNRLLFRDRCQQAMNGAHRHHGRVALLFLDLDRFKTINDSLGHQVGDSLLCAVAGRLVDSVRETDTVCRQGGDEFLIVLAESDEGEVVARKARQLLAMLAEPFEVHGHRLVISASVGISLYPDDGEDVDTLLKQADTAMYRAKSEGRNTARFFSERMNEDAMARLTLQQALRGALAGQEFSVVYQPQVASEDGRIQGLEALLRWTHPMLGEVPPSSFIPVAEDAGLIDDIGRWVLDAVCAQIELWRASGLRVPRVAVNLSPIQFQRVWLVDHLRDALARHGLHAGMLEVELTESLLLNQSELVMRNLEGLRSLGVQLAIDDFGTGYSSLAYLRRLQVSKLKIDQSFVHGLPHDPDNAAIVRAIIQMARSLRLQTVAEGVESESQARFLTLVGCNAQQGYLYSEPLSPEAIASRL